MLCFATSDVSGWPCQRQMASLPSLSLSANTNLQPLPLKNSLPTSTKSTKLSRSDQRSSMKTQFNGNFEPKDKPIGFNGALGLLNESAKIEPLSYIPLLQQCIDDNSVSETQLTHGRLYKMGIHQDYFVMTFLVNVYAKCGSMVDARKVFDHMPRRNAVAWTTLMTGYVKDSRPDLAVEVFLEMMEAGSLPSEFTLGMALNACTCLCSLGLGKQFHGYIVKYRSDHVSNVGNALCSLYSKLGRLECAVKAFEKVEEKDVISWTAVISACGDNGDAETGLKFFVRMLVDEVEPNELTLTTVLSLCCETMSLSLGAQVHAFSIKLGYEKTNVKLRNSVMYLYLKCGLMDEANNLFNRTACLNLVTWNAMIAGHAQAMELATDDLSAHRSGSEALTKYLKLNRLSLQPDLFTFSSILTICTRLLALEQGQQIHTQIVKSGFLSDIVVETTLVNMYNKCGNFEGARKAFLEMSTRTLISWTTMISGLAMQGQYQLALQLFEDMRLVGIRPNQITFVGVLAACSHAGMVSEALEYFEMMQTEYRIRPVPDHYTCIIEMFARMGRLDEAFDFIKKKNVEPTEIMWLLLIAGCRNHGFDALGFFAAEELLKLKPKAPDTFAFLLNMYAAAERWEDVSSLKNLMREESIAELNEWSWIRIKDKVYSFETHEQKHSHHAKVYELLEELHKEASRNRRESLRSMEAVQESVGQPFSSAVYYSEELALACGLLNTHTGSPILITKSIATRRDCHDFMKVISSIKSREVIIRDSKRLHVIVNGSCSCADFGVFL